MIRVFIGTDETQYKAEKVVEYSIKKNTTSDVDIVFMRPGWQTMPTGFSSHRYLIPSLCNYEGYAIYLDVDMLVLGDISELWQYKTAGRWTTLIEGRDHVSVIDCSAFKGLMPDTEILKTWEGKFIARRAIGNRYNFSIPKEWDMYTLPPCGEGKCVLRNEFCSSSAKLIHYTDLDTQPWKPDPSVKYKSFHCKKTEDLFFDYYNAAVKQSI